MHGKQQKHVYGRLIGTHTPHICVRAHCTAAIFDLLVLRTLAMYYDLYAQGPLYAALPAVVFRNFLAISCFLHHLVYDL